MLKTAKIIGLNSDTDAAIALIAKGEFGNFYFFAIVASSLEDAFTRTRQVLSEAETAFYASDLSVADRLAKIRDLIKTSLIDAADLHILLAATQEEAADTFFYFLGTSGNLEGYLARVGQRTDLNQMSEGQVISGIIKDGDRIIMATKTLDGILQDNLLGLEKIEMEFLEDEIASKLPEAENYPVAAIVIEKEKIVPEITEEKVKEPVEVFNPESGVKTKAFLKAVGRFTKRTVIRLIPRSKRNIAIIGVILLILVIISVGIGYKNKKDAEVLSSRDNLLQGATDEYNKAISLKDSNTSDALSSLKKSEEVIDQLIKSDPKNSKAEELRKKIEESLPQISKIYTISEFSVWLDLNLIKQGFSAKSLSLSLDNLLILDPDKKTLVKINTKTKSQSILAGQDKIGSAQMVSLNGSLAFIFSKDKGVLKIDTTNNNLSVVAKPDEGWGIIADLYAFGGNVYLLDKVNNQIWKYLPTESGYSDKREYLKGKADLSDSSKMEIDSSIWILKNPQEIIKYTQGVVDFFSYSGLDKPVKEISSFFVSDETENLYILDKGNSRLLVLDKKGNYLAQYQSDKLTTITDFIVIEAQKKVYLLEKDKIYQIDLK